MEEQLDYGTKNSIKGLAIYFAMIFMMALVFRKGWIRGGK